ncbi:NUDIX domain-containing protein [Candidatus Microgenomates bacterium]|nr:NUDIX domain-containing protein [Candidatus Microgenomates bacterium]
MTRVKRIPFKEFSYIYHRVPRLCVDALIKTTDGIVLSKRDILPAKGWWHIPGGTVLLEETLEQAVKRVAKEELGVIVMVKNIAGVIEYFGKSNFGGHSVDIVHLAHITSGSLHGSKQGKEVKVFKVLPKHLVSEHKKFLETHPLNE